MNSSKDEACIFFSEEPIVTNNTQFILECKTDKGIKISAPNIQNYYLLKEYQFNEERYPEEQLFRFAMVVEKILDCMRQHKKDAPAKGREYIENEIIAGNEYKKKVLETLKRVGIIYVDRTETHLYKVNKDVLGDYGIGWQSLVKFGKDVYKKL